MTATVVDGGGRQKYVRGGENSEKHGDLVGMSHFNVRKRRLVSALLQRRGLILSFCDSNLSGTLTTQDVVLLQHPVLIQMAECMCSIYINVGYCTELNKKTFD